MSKEINRLVSSLCKSEGKKSQIKVGDMREAVALLGEELYQCPSLAIHLIEAGRKRWLKKNMARVKRNLLALTRHAEDKKKARRKK